MYGCESWTKESWVPKNWLEGLMLKLKLQSFGHLMWRPDSLEKTPCWERLKQEEKGTTEIEMAGCHHWLDGHEFEKALEVSWWTGRPYMLQSMGSQRVGHDWTELNWKEMIRILTFFNENLKCKFAYRRMTILIYKKNNQSLLCLSWERILLQCGKSGFNLWVRKIPWRREWLPTPVFWPGEFHGLDRPWVLKESDTNEWFSPHFIIYINNKAKYY